MSQPHDIATGLERLEIEYEQVLAGSETLEARVLTPLDDLRVDLQQVMDRAPLLGSEQRAAVLDRTAQACQAAADGVALDASPQPPPPPRTLSAKPSTSDIPSR